jgi:WD40 repeat protein
MNRKAVTILLIGFLSLSACNFPGLQGGDEMDVPDASPTAAPIEATALPSPSPTTEALDPTEEPLPVTSKKIPISIDNVKELTIQTQLHSELHNIHAAFDLSVDGQYIALSHWYVPENVVRIWDLEQGSFIESLTFHSKDVVAIAFSPIGTTLASASQDGMVALWEVGTWEMMESFLGYAEGVSSLAFSPDGSMLAVGGYRNQLGVWRLEDGERLHYFDGSGPHVVNKVTFTNDGREYYADTGYADITAWSTADGALIRSFRGEACIGGYDLSADETMLAYSSSCSAANEPHDPLATIAIRDVTSGEALVYGAMKETSTHLYFTNDDALMISNSGGTIRFWDAEDGSLHYQLPPTGRVVDFMLSKDGSLLIVGDADGDVLIYGVGS